MPTYTFSMTAFVTVYADTEYQARDSLLATLYMQDEDVMYGEAAVYIPSSSMVDAELEEVYDEE